VWDRTQRGAPEKGDLPPVHSRQKVG
jgi:hypothetical protein